MEQYQYVEIELDGIITVKRIPCHNIDHYNNGSIVRKSIADYFRTLGYDVGIGIKIL